MSPWWFTLLLFVASAGASYLLRPKPEVDSPTPGDIDDLTLPPIEEGRAIPVIWGTVKMEKPSIPYYWGFWVNESDPLQYNIGVMWAWCIGPVDAIVSIQFDDKEIILYDCGYQFPYSYPGIAADYPIERETDLYFPELGFARCHIYDHDLFGGLDEGGGVRGWYEFFYGTDGQPKQSDLYNHWKDPGENPEEFTTLPRLCFSCARAMGGIGWGTGFYIGTAPYLTPHQAVLRRCPNQLGLSDEKHNIDGDSNPACMIYEILTDDIWGLKISASLIDVEQLQVVGQTLYDEGFGLSMQQASQTGAREVIQDILRHVDGVVFPDPRTGLMRFELIRANYKISALTSIDETSILELEEFHRPGIEETHNKVIVTFHDREQAYQKKLAVFHDQANIEAQGVVKTQDMSFLGITKAALAQRVAAREGKSLSFPFARIRLKVNRTAWNLRPGQPFKFSYSPYGITDMVCRAVRVGFGAITDGAITIEAVEDVFGVAWTAYSPPPASGWSYPIDPPD